MREYAVSITIGKVIKADNRHEAMEKFMELLSGENAINNLWDMIDMSEIWTDEVD